MHRSSHNDDQFQGNEHFNKPRHFDLYSIVSDKHPWGHFWTSQHLESSPSSRFIDGGSSRLFSVNCRVKRKKRECFRSFSSLLPDYRICVESIEAARSKLCRNMRISLDAFILGESVDNADTVVLISHVSASQASSFDRARLQKEGKESRLSWTNYLLVKTT